MFLLGKRLLRKGETKSCLRRGRARRYGNITAAALRKVDQIKTPTALSMPLKA
jgi:hypothetical protein